MEENYKKSQNVENASFNLVRFTAQIENLSKYHGTNWTAEVRENVVLRFWESPMDFTRWIFPIGEKRGALRTPITKDCHSKYDLFWRVFFFREGNLI